MRGHERDYPFNFSFSEQDEANLEFLNSLKLPENSAGYAAYLNTLSRRVEDGYFFGLSFTKKAALAMIKVYIAFLLQKIEKGHELNHPQHLAVQYKINSAFVTLCSGKPDLTTINHIMKWELQPNGPHSPAEYPEFDSLLQAARGALQEWREVHRKEALVVLTIALALFFFGGPGLLNKIIISFLVQLMGLKCGLMWHCSNALDTDLTSAFGIDAQEFSIWDLRFVQALLLLGLLALGEDMLLATNIFMFAGLQVFDKPLFQGKPVQSVQPFLDTYLSIGNNPKWHTGECDVTPSTSESDDEPAY